MKRAYVNAKRFPSFRAFGFAVSLSTVLLCLGCNRAGIPDAKLKAVFDDNRDDFNKLVSMTEQDRKLVRIRFDSTYMDTDTGVKKNVALSEDRWQQYRTLFRKLELTDGLERAENAIFFYSHCEGSALDEDCKGFAYSKNSLAPTAETLDDPRDGEYFKPLYPNWYLFRIVK